MALSGRRVRQGRQGDPDPEEYQQTKQARHDFQPQASPGILDLYYFDASGVCFTPSLPYAWQEKGQTIILESGPRKHFNVLGFLSKHHA